MWAVVGVFAVVTIVRSHHEKFDGTGYPRQFSGGGLAGGIVLTDTTGPSTSVRTLCLANLGRPRIVKDVSENCASG